MNALDPTSPTRPLGWAGYLLEVPRGFRMAKVSGDHAQGKLVLADDERARLELIWATETKRKFDPEAYGRKKLEAAIKTVKPAPPVTRLDNAAVGIVVTTTDAAAKLDRFIGHCALTHRVFEVVYYHGTAIQDHLVRSITMTGLNDQPADQPMKWAYFDCSFIVPAGFLFRSSTLNLGDMTVRLAVRDSETRGPTLIVRQIYPASLALARRPINEWLEAWVKESWDTYRVKRSGWLRKGPIPTDPTTDALGPGSIARTSLRWLLHLMYFRMSRHCVTRLVQDASCDRMIGVRVTDGPDAAPGLAASVLEHGLHWAGIES